MLDNTDYLIAMLVVFFAGLLFWCLYIRLTRSVGSRRDGIKNPILFAAKVHLLLVDGQRERALQECRAVISDDISGPRVALLDSVACIPVFWDHPDMIPIAVEAIDKAIEREPTFITLKGTRASLCIEEGKLDEGIHLLKEVQMESESEGDQAITSYYLSYAALKKGDTPLR